jgi:hypothetical protein
MGHIPIHVAVQLARLEKKPKFQVAVRYHYRKNPEEALTKERLAEVIRSLGGSSAKQGDRSKNRSALAEQIGTAPEQIDARMAPNQHRLFPMVH